MKREFIMKPERIIINALKELTEEIKSLKEEIKNLSDGVVTVIRTPMPEPTIPRNTDTKEDLEREEEEKIKTQ